MAADLLGRRKTLLSGGVLTVTCNLLMAFAPNLFTICLAMGLNALAMTMFSGTFTALVYDSLKTEGREDEYIQVSANSSQISMLANAVGSLASLLKRFLGFAGFYLLSAAFEGVSTAALALMEEPIVTKAQASRGRQTLRALPGPVHQTGAQQPEHPAHHAAGGQAHRFQRRRLGAQLPDQNVLAAAAH